MLAYFLFFFYLIFGILVLHNFIQRKIFPFRIHHTVSIFLFKVFMGCLYGWVFLHYYGGDDTWNFFNESKEQTHLLVHRPGAFFQEFWPAYSWRLTGHQGWQAFLFYVNHFERWFIIKGLALLNVLSAKNYYVDVLLFDLITIRAQLRLFKLLFEKYPSQIGLNFLLIFFIPSVIFWCSGIRAEALLLLFIVMTLYNGNDYALRREWSSLRGILIGFCGLLLFRYQFMLVFLPAFVAYLYSLIKKTESPVFFNRVYVLIAVLFVGSLFLTPSWQLSAPLIKSQADFFRLHGNTRYALDSLHPGPASFFEILPQAAVNSLLRPFPWEGKSLLQSVSSIEILLLLAGLLFYFTNRRPREQISHPLYWLFLYYGLSQFFLIGYVVPFPGAIVRYRIIAFLFLILFFYTGHPQVQKKLRYWIFKLH